MEIKWVPSTSNHIAVLREDDNFSIYDFGNNIEEPELVIDLSFLDSKKKLLAEQKTFFTDFAFSTNKDGFDCGDFAVFFMNNWGEIYYQCPVIINGMRLPKATVDFLKKRVLHEKKASVAEKELLERITSFLSSIDEFIVEHDAENYQIDAPKVTEHLNLYENVIQG